MTIGLEVIIGFALFGFAILYWSISGESTGNSAEDHMNAAILGLFGCAVLFIDFIAFIIWLAIN